MGGNTGADDDRFGLELKCKPLFGTAMLIARPEGFAAQANRIVKSNRFPQADSPPRKTAPASRFHRSCLSETGSRKASEEGLIAFIG